MPSPTATWFPWPSNQKAIQLQNPAPRICFVMSSLVPIVPIFNSLENRDEEKSIGANTKWRTRVQFLRSRHKWNREVRHGETVITRAQLLNLPQLQRCFFDFIGHLQRDCANLPWREPWREKEMKEKQFISCYFSPVPVSHYQSRFHESELCLISGLYHLTTRQHQVRFFVIQYGERADSGLFSPALGHLSLKFMVASVSMVVCWSWSGNMTKNRGLRKRG